MSIDKRALKNETIYQIFVRNYSKEGKIKNVTLDLPRIKDLGVSTIYLLPIHPIGKEARKGKYGSPYSIQDYRKINRQLGSMKDFEELICEAHKMDLKVMMDVVFNHTSLDATLVKKHPEFYYYKNGKRGNRIGDWTDIIDLDFNNQKMRKYLIDTLVFWVKKGVDGFRCDVAPLIPLDFWKKANEVTAKYNPDLMWLSESVEPDFIKYLRSQNYTGLCDAELYSTFDMLYDYDTFAYLQKYLDNKGTLEEYLQHVSMQEYIYPKDYVKIRFLENHDRQRINSYGRNELFLKAITAWSFFQNGAGFIYAGQEVKAKKYPNLFEKDPIDLEVKDQYFYEYMKTLIQIKKMPIFKENNRFDIYKVDADDIIFASIESSQERLWGLFNLSGEKKIVKTDLDDGEYINLIDRRQVVITNNSLELESAYILKQI